MGYLSTGVLEEKCHMVMNRGDVFDCQLSDIKYVILIPILAIPAFLIIGAMIKANRGDILKQAKFCFLFWIFFQLKIENWWNFIYNYHVG